MTYYKIGLILFSIALLMFLMLTTGSKIGPINSIDGLFGYVFLVFGLVMLSVIFFVIGFFKNSQH